MELFVACPENSAPDCNDTHVTNVGLILFLPAILLAVLLARPLSRFVPAHRVIGAVVAAVGAVAFLYYSWSGVALIAWLAVIVGLALYMSERVQVREAGR